MNKKTYIIAFLVIAGALGLTMWSFSSSMTPYVNLKQARKLDVAVQVRGKILRDEAHPIRYDATERALRFWIKDTANEEIEVVYHGAKPDAFDTAPGTAAHGYVRRDGSGKEVFASDSLVIQCPSKYDDKSSIYKRADARGGGM